MTATQHPTNVLAGTRRDRTRRSAATLLICTLVTVGLSGCISKQDLETDPVTVASSGGGSVVCQLYLPNIVRYDEAISRSEGVSDEEAQSLCRQEGQRRADARKQDHHSRAE